MCNSQYPQINQSGMPGVERTFTTPMPQSYATQQTYPTMPQSYNTEQGYTQFDASGNLIQVNPNDPSSPLSVQPYGPGTPLENNISMQSELPETLTHYEYIPGYLRANLGALMRVEFLIGDGTTDRVGRLREVGASYIVLESLDGTSKLMCDLYSIKFITIMEQATPQFVAESTLQSQNI